MWYVFFQLRGLLTGSLNEMYEIPDLSLPKSTGLNVSS